MTLFLHELHRVVGRTADEFESAFSGPGGWMEALGHGDDARLLYFVHQAHGSGPSYRVITITAVRDGAAWERLAHRAHSGDLREWVRHVDSLRHGVTAKVLLPVEWSPIVDVDFATVPVSPQDHDPTLFMEDTGWPDVALDEYIEFWRRDYYPLLHQQPESSRLLEIQACWMPALGTGPRPEATLWQRVRSPARLLGLLSTDVPVERTAPGTYMAKALEYRDQWESRLLRTSRWSPWS